MTQIAKTGNWDWEISSHTSWWGWSLRELWLYRSLLARLVRRDFLVQYQQTILGPIWIFLQPIVTLITFLIFSQMIGISTGHIPPILFYLTGIILWSYFSESFISTSFTFVQSVSIYSKVYFPRIIIPLSVISSQFLRFLVQCILLLLVLIYYWLFRHLSIFINGWLFILPFVILIISAMSLGLGLIFSVLTARYRDLGNIVHLGIRLLMFFTPVIYPLAILPEKIRWVASLNPLSSLFEIFRFALFGEGSFTLMQFLYSAIIAIIIFFIGLLLFNKQGDKLMDVI